MNKRGWKTAFFFLITLSAIVASFLVYRNFQKQNETQTKVTLYDEMQANPFVPESPKKEDAFQKEWFEEKLVDVLKNKPYIVGDISHDKLRLSGFTLTKDNNNPKNINNLEDYILEYCNFGAPFFVVKKR